MSAPDRHCCENWARGAFSWNVNHKAAEPIRSLTATDVTQHCNLLSGVLVLMGLSSMFVSPSDQFQTSASHSNEPPSESWAVNSMRRLWKPLDRDQHMMWLPASNHCFDSSQINISFRTERYSIGAKRGAFCEPPLKIWTLSYLSKGVPVIWMVSFNWRGNVTPAFMKVAAIVKIFLQFRILRLF